MWDLRYEIRDKRCEMRDLGYGIRTSELGDRIIVDDSLLSSSECWTTHILYRIYKPKENSDENHYLYNPYILLSDFTSPVWMFR
jgi:hypothetical protein